MPVAVESYFAVLFAVAFEGKTTGNIKQIGKYVIRDDADLEVLQPRISVICRKSSNNQQGRC